MLVSKVQVCYFQASTDIMIDLMLDQPIDKAKELCRLFIGMVQGTITDEKSLPL